MPGVLAVGVAAGALAGAEGGTHGVEHDAHVLEPGDGVAGLEVVVAHEAGVHLGVGVEHVATEELAGGDLNHGALLDRGAGRGRAHAHVGGATGVGRLLQGDDAGAALGGSHGRGQAGQAGGNDDDVSLKLLHANPPC